MTQNDKTLGILSHVLAIFTWILGPLIIYLATQDKFAKDNAREALNWQISITIYYIISFVLIIILVGILLMVALGVINLVFCILAAVKASDNQVWNYPLTIRFLKE